MIVNAIGHQHMCHMTDIASHTKMNDDYEQRTESCAMRAALTVTHTGSPLSLCLLVRAPSSDVVMSIGVKTLPRWSCDALELQPIGVHVMECLQCHM